MPIESEHPSDPSRREFISRLTLAGTALPFASFPPSAHAANRPATATSAAPRPATCIHAFSKPLHWMSYTATAELIAETGYGGIDYTVRPLGHVLPEKVEDDLPRAVEAARKAGLKVEMITTAIVDPRDPHAERILKTASKLGVKYYRLGYLKYDNNAPTWATLQKHKSALRELAELNKSLGLHGAYQNHAGVNVGGPVWDLFELLRDLDPRWIGCQYDIRHATVEGGLAWPLGLRLLHPWIKCSDIKDFKWVQSKGRAEPDTVPLGEGVVNFDRYFPLVRELNIAGPISLHLEYPPFEGLRPPLPEKERRVPFAVAMRKDLQFLQGCMAKHGIG